MDVENEGQQNHGFRDQKHIPIKKRLESKPMEWNQTNDSRVLPSSAPL